MGRWPKPTGICPIWPTRKDLPEPSLAQLDCSLQLRGKCPAEHSCSCMRWEVLLIQQQEQVEETRAEARHRMGLSECCWCVPCRQVGTEEKMQYFWMGSIMLCGKVGVLKWRNLLEWRGMCYPWWVIWRGKIPCLGFCGEEEGMLCRREKLVRSPFCVNLLLFVRVRVCLL